MTTDFLSEAAATTLVSTYLANERESTAPQKILDSGEVPRLKGYTIRPGKVSDSIFGGKGSFLKKTSEGYSRVEFENPPLNAKNGTPLRIMIRTERISTHDINRGSIPFKDQILASNHHFMRRMLAPYLGTSQFKVKGLDDKTIVIAAEELRQLGFENVIRAYMAKSTTSTSMYQNYIKGARNFCGHELPEGLIANGPLPYIMDTPSTKSDEHDESISPHELVQRGICHEIEYRVARDGAMRAFRHASRYLRMRGIILVDTKTEHGVNRQGKVVSQDELLTMDSSRFWLINDYQTQLEQLTDGVIKELNPVSYSKEFARGFSEGEKGYTDDQRMMIAVRYIQGIQHLLGQRFNPDMRGRDERVINGLTTIVDTLVD